MLFDLEGSLVAQTSVSLDGSFELSGVTAGTYHLFAEGELADGRIAGGAYDVNGDGVPDILSVEGGDPLTGLAIAATARGSVTPPVTGVQLSVDLDGQSGDQRLQSIGGAGPDQKVVLEVYARGLEDLVGVGVTVSYDSSQVYLRDLNRATTC